MTGFSRQYGDKGQHEQRNLIKGTGYFIRRDRHEVSAIKFNLIWSGRTVKKVKRAYIHESFSTEENIHRKWTLFQGRVASWILPFLLKSIQLEMIMNEMSNITGYIWNGKKDTIAKLIPQGSYKSELRHLIISLSKTVQWSSVFFSHTSPELSLLQKNLQQ